MITKESIDSLKDYLDIEAVVESYLKLTQRGAVKVGCCPFHDEKSGSFTVSAAKQMFKCFGCGEGGDVFKFVMKQEDIDFVPAVRALASKYNFELEESEASLEEKQAAAKKADLWKITADTCDHYRDKLLGLNGDHWAVQELLGKRKFTEETLLDFQIGFAPDEARVLSERLINKGTYDEATELGLIKTNTETAYTYDVFRNRIIFPIHNDQGHIVGFGGRKDPACARDENPKYINSKQSTIYQKDRVLYGLYQAKKYIKEAGYAIVVEGYSDVMSMHQGGAANTVAMCGTAFTDHHAKLLKRYTNKVVIMTDGDDAGEKSAFKMLEVLLANGLSPELCILPPKEDPDTFARQLMSPDLPIDVSLSHKSFRYQYAECEPVQEP